MKVKPGCEDRVRTTQKKPCITSPTATKENHAEHRKCPKKGHKPQPQYEYERPKG